MAEVDIDNLRTQRQRAGLAHSVRELMGELGHPSNPSGFQPEGPTERLVPSKPSNRQRLWLPEGLGEYPALSPDQVEELFRRPGEYSEQPNDQAKRTTQCRWSAPTWVPRWRTVLTSCFVACINSIVRRTSLA